MLRVKDDQNQLKLRELFSEADAYINECIAEWERQNTAGPPFPLFMTCQTDDVGQQYEHYRNFHRRVRDWINGEYETGRVARECELFAKMIPLWRQDIPEAVAVEDFDYVLEVEAMKNDSVRLASALAETLRIMDEGSREATMTVERQRMVDMLIQEQTNNHQREPWSAYPAL